MANTSERSKRNGSTGAARDAAAETASAVTAAAAAGDLARQVQALKDDVAGIARSLAELGRAQGDAVIGSAIQGVETLRSNSIAAYDAATTQAADTVRQRPAAAMGLAVALGFLVGYVVAARR